MIWCLRVLCLIVAWTSYFGFAISQSALAEASHLEAGGQEHPNIVFILTDDQSIGDIGAFGASDILTPNLDRLAQSGIRLTQFYAAAPICSPSRAAILTGRVPERVGVPANATSFEGSLKGLPLREVTLAELLREEGYQTALIGKWHLGFDEHLRPQHQGFDHTYGFLVGAVDNYSHFTYWRGANRHDLYRNNEEVFQQGKFLPDAMIEETFAFIDQVPETQPFFVYFALGLPHYPYQGDADWIDYYNRQDVPYPRNIYSAFVSTMDERIGALMDGLERRGLREDTILIFQSDHGHSTEERAHNGGGDTLGLRGAKRSLFEGGVRVPAIVSWPRQLAPNQTRPAMLSALDWTPTLADIVDANTSDIAFDGRVMTDLWFDPLVPGIRSQLHWEFFEQWAIRDGDWKLLYKPKDTSLDFEAPAMQGDDTYFLVNLAEDPTETTNLAGLHPEKVAQLLQVREQMRVKHQPRDWEIGTPILESKP